MKEWDISLMIARFKESQKRINLLITIDRRLLKPFSQFPF